jgi:uncharacterized protein YjdB
LQALVAVAESYDEAGFTPESRTPFATALKDAKTVLGNAEALDADVVPVYNALRLAVTDGLTPKASTAALSALAQAAREIEASLGPDGAALAAEVAKVAAVLGNANASQADVDAAFGTLSNAVRTSMSALASKPPTIVEVGSKNVVAKVKLAQSQLTLVKKKSLTLPAAVYFSGTHPSYGDTVVWKSSNPKVAKVNQNGKITAVKKGTATITVTSKAANAKGKQVSAKIKVKVVTKKPKSKVTKVTAKVPKSMKLGQVLYITGKYSSSKATGVKVSYSTSKYQRVVVDKTGRLLAKSKGKDTLTVKAGKKTKKYTITVK